MEATIITEHVRQIADDDGVYCTLVQGDQLAILLDTGYGKQPLRAYVESLIHTPYMVINSHVHPDHIGGNHHFETVYAHPNDFPLFPKMEKDKYATEYSRKPIMPDTVIDLGGLHAKVVSIAGHTPGSIGLLLQEERILLAGDALNPCLWMFPPESLSISQLIVTLETVDKLPFDKYLFGHWMQPLPHEFLRTILHNAKHLSFDPSTHEVLLGIDTYQSKYTDAYGESVIIFSQDKL